MSDNHVSPLEETISDAAAAHKLILNTELENRRLPKMLDLKSMRDGLHLLQIAAEGDLRVQRLAREPVISDFDIRVNHHVQVLLGHAAPQRRERQALVGATNAAAAIAEYEVGRQLLLDDPMLEVTMGDTSAKTLLDTEWRVDLDAKVRSAALDLGASETALRATVAKLVSPAIGHDSPGGRSTL